MESNSFQPLTLNRDQQFFNMSSGPANGTWNRRVCLFWFLQSLVLLPQSPYLSRPKRNERCLLKSLSKIAHG